MKIFLFAVLLFFAVAAELLEAGESLLPKPVEFALPFASKPEAERGYVDIPIKKSAAAADAFLIDFQCDVPETIGHITFYFRSGKGWYSYDLREPDDLSAENSRVQMKFSPASQGVQIEGEPGPLAQADTIRFSIWRGASKDAVVKLYDIRPVSFPIIALLDDDGGGKEFGPQLLRQMNRGGIPTGNLPQDQVTEKSLENRRVVVLPLNDELPPETVSVLKKFVENGGKLVAFYQLPPELMQTLGFKAGRYVKPPEGDRSLAEIRFDRSGNDPLNQVPDLKQKSWNIVAAEPGPGYGAKIAAWWYDATGEKTKYPALLLSERGAFVSHILTNEDRENKQKFLLELFGLYDSSFRHEAAVEAWKSLFRIGDARTLSAEKRAALENRILSGLKNRGFQAEAAFFTNSPRENTSKNVPNYPALQDALLEMRENLVREYCESVPSREPEFRAWWEHAGLGAYPGDWDRTMKELSESGFNAVISNLLWGGSAHYASEVLPRSEKFRRYGDQIEQALAAGKKYGLEVHAWQVCYWLNGSPPEFIEEMKQAGRTQVSFDGTVGQWLCPSHPENIDLETASFLELAEKYGDLNGIHYDYIRYPDGEHCFCNGCRDRFTGETGSKINQWPQDVRSGGPLAEEYEQWRCDQITKLVRRVHTEVKKIRPEMKISAAVFSRYPGCRRGVAQDWPVWVENGWLDFICPMNYTQSPVAFESLIESQKPLIRDRVALYPGIGATATGTGMTPDQVVAQIEIARKMNAPGFVIFNLDARTIQVIPPYTKLGATKK